MYKQNYRPDYLNYLVNKLHSIFIILSFAYKCLYMELYFFVCIMSYIILITLIF